MEQKTYLSKRGWIIYLPLALFPFIFSFGFLYISQTEPEKLMLSFWIFVLLYILLLSILKTNYTISNEKLIIKFSFFKKSVQLNDITTIKQRNQLWVMGWKLALSAKGIIISSKTGMDILISPENEEEFIADLLKINPEIKIC
jgi:hypothetical protein